MKYSRSSDVSGGKWVEGKQQAQFSKMQACQNEDMEEVLEKMLEKQTANNCAESLSMNSNVALHQIEVCICMKREERSSQLSVQILPGPNRCFS